MIFNIHKNILWPVILIIGYSFIFCACQLEGNKGNINDVLTIEESIKIPVVGKNKYIRISEETGNLLIRQENKGIVLYNCLTDSVLWELKEQDVIFKDDPLQTIDIVDDLVVILGYKTLRAHSLETGELLFVHNVPDRISSSMGYDPIFKVDIDGVDYLLTDYNTKANGWGNVNLMAMEKKDYETIRLFSLFNLNQDTPIANLIGRYEKGSTILAEGPKLPLIKDLYTVVNNTLYHLEANEPKVWATSISLDDPIASIQYDLQLSYPVNRYFLPANQKNNLHEVSIRMDQNLRILGLFYDKSLSAFVVPYFRALHDWEMVIFQNQKGSKSQLELGFQRMQVAIFNENFQKIKELTLPVNIHTVIGVSNQTLFLKGFEEGDDYDIIYKASLDL
jgi:hypothetical protein